MNLRWNILCDVMSNIEVAVSSSSLSVDHSLRDSFAVELGELIDEMDILKEKGSSSSSAHRVLVIVYWVASACSQSLSLH